MYKLIVRNETPPGLFRFWSNETGSWIPDPLTHGDVGYYAFDDLVTAVLSHYKANKLNPPSTAIIEDQVCSRIPGRFCNDEHGGRRDSFVGSLTFAMQTVIQGTATLLDWAMSNTSKVPQEEQTWRASICRSCPFNIDPSDCLSCGNKLGQIMSLISKISPSGPTPVDEGLKSCSVCLCNLRVKVRVPKNIILSHMPKDQLSRLPSHCWLNHEYKG